MIFQPLKKVSVPIAPKIIAQRLCKYCVKMQLILNISSNFFNVSSPLKRGRPPPCKSESAVLKITVTKVKAVTQRKTNKQANKQTNAH